MLQGLVRTGRTMFLRVARKSFISSLVCWFSSEIAEVFKDFFIGSAGEILFAKSQNETIKDNLPGLDGMFLRLGLMILRTKFKNQMQLTLKMNSSICQMVFFNILSIEYSPFRPSSSGEEISLSRGVTIFISSQQRQVTINQISWD